MRSLAVGLFAFAAACGSGASESGTNDVAPASASSDQPPAAASPSPSPSAAPVGPQAGSLGAYPMLVAGEAALPGCDAANEGRLVFVKADSTMHVCSASTWSDVTATFKGAKGDAGAAGAAGTQGTAGLSITALYNLDSTGVDYCTRWNNVSCTFRGGRLVLYSNGMKYVSGGIAHFESYAITGSGVDANQTDSDTVVVDTSVYATAAGDVMTAQLFKGARTGSDTSKQFWLVFKYDSNEASVVFDTNNNGTYDPGTDEVVEVLTNDKIF